MTQPNIPILWFVPPQLKGTKPTVAYRTDLAGYCWKQIDDNAPIPLGWHHEYGGLWRPWQEPPPDEPPYRKG